MPILRSDRRRSTCRIFALWAVLACLALTVNAQEPPATTANEGSNTGSATGLEANDPVSQELSQSELSHREDLWLEIRDAKGRLPRDASAKDLELRLGDQRLAIESLGPATQDARIVLYFDRPLSSTGTIRRAADSFSGLAESLSQLGDVEMVVADPEAELLMDTRETLILSERLSRMALTESGGEAILELRRKTLRDLNRPSLGQPLSPDDIAALVIESVREEAELIQTHRDTLLTFLSDNPDSRPQILLLVFDGFDTDPLAFYAQHLEESALRTALRAAASDPTLLALEAAHLGTSRTLAALGWTVLPVSLGPVGRGAMRFDSMETEDLQGTSTTAQGITLNPGSLFKRRDRDADDSPATIEVSLIDPAASRATLARLTGGQALSSDASLRDAVKRLGERYRLSYQAVLPLDTGLVPLEIRPTNSDWSIRSAGWKSVGTPPEIARLRVRRLFAGEEPQQGLDVVAAVHLPDQLEGDDNAKSGEIEVRLNLRDLEEAARGRHDLRLTITALDHGTERQIVRQFYPDIDLSALDEWPLRTELEVPSAARQLAVLIEDLDTGRWGGSIAAVVERQRSSVVAGEPLLPAPTVVEIERPERDVLRGRVRFNTRVYDSNVRRVAFVLDDREVASADREPWSARLELGRVPRRRDLVAIAYDAAGKELGRHAVVVNGGRGGLGIRFVRPEAPRGTGWVEVEAAVTVPLENRLDRVLFFWNNEPIATLYAPPFVQNVFIPEEQSAGYIRAVAMLDDGTVTEDVMFMNGPENSVSVDVNLVELYTVVTDRNSRPVRGLTAEDFKIYEEGTRQEISSFSDASDLPLTLGMAIDSSASMFVKMPRIQEAAITFLESTFGEQDSAFIVDFDSTPRLARAPTQDLDRLVRAIRNLEPDGRTALWESVVYSLVQLQGVRGRKALIVFSDGADEDDQFPFRTCLDLAERMGVPIYLILMRYEPKESGGLNLFNRSFDSRVDRLINTTGGRVFNAKEYRDLGEVYAEIEQELRSQYLLAYYPKNSNGRGWRDVRIEVSKSGLKPRTLSGYWQ